MIWVGICEHGHAYIGIVKRHADETELREMASSAARVELRESLTFDGGCDVCQKRYEKNCDALGIEP